jgi:hypothetical protein
MVAPGAGNPDGMPPGVVKVGLVPLVALLFMPVVVLVLGVLDPVELPTLLEPAVLGAATLPLAPPVPCARTIDEVSERTEVKAIV